MCVEITSQTVEAVDRSGKTPEIQFFLFMLVYGQSDTFTRIRGYTFGVQVKFYGSEEGIPAPFYEGAMPRPRIFFIIFLEWKLY